MSKIKIKRIEPEYDYDPYSTQEYKCLARWENEGGSVVVGELCIFDDGVINDDIGIEYDVDALRATAAIMLSAADEYDRLNAEGKIKPKE